MAGESTGGNGSSSPARQRASLVATQLGIRLNSILPSRTVRSIVGEQPTLESKSDSRPTPDPFIWFFLIDEVAMGWASCFEDICQRREDAKNSTTCAFVGPAGNTPQECLTPIALEAALIEKNREWRERQEIDDLQLRLAGSFDRLRLNYNAVNRDLIAQYERDQWIELSKTMDDLEREIRQLDTNTLMAGEGELLSTAGSLSERLDSALARGKAAILYLEKLLVDVFAELDVIQWLTPRIPRPRISERDRALENNAAGLFKGLKLLKTQVQALEQQRDDLQIQLADDVLKRLFDKDSAP